MRLKELAIILFGICIFSANAANVAKSDLVVDNIQVGKMDQDTSPSQFSILINFKNTGSTLKKWQLGFYMPRSLYGFALQKLNPDLQMQICDTSSKCSNLRYVKATSVADNDLSEGYFTLLEPLNNYPLTGDVSYYIRISHSNQWAPANISSLPQSFFIVEPSNKSNDIPKIYTLNTELLNYTILGYNHEDTEKSIKAKLTENWQNSQQFNGLSPYNRIVPSPVIVSPGVDQNGFAFGKKLVIHNQLNTDNGVVNQWAQILSDDLHIKKKYITVDNDVNATSGIIITDLTAPKVINNNPEGYRLTINSNNITIETLTSTGAYYAFQTLRQLWYQNRESLPSLSIVDYPRYKYRGILLDTARHYFSVTDIEKLIDVMASQKLNTLHLHLSDDEAFRLSLANYPGLTAIGATRGLGQAIGPNLLIQNNLDNTNSTELKYPVANTPYSGQYSPEDIKEIIAYANLNQISVIPELDLPGHARALIKAMPEVMVDPNDNSQYVSIQGYTDDVLPICTYNTDISIGSQFTSNINGILNDTVTLFNNQTTIYAQSNEISIGGDEVSSHAWDNDTSCRDEWGSLAAIEKSHLFFSKLSEVNSGLLLSGWQQFVQNPDNSISKNAVAAGKTGHVWVWDPSNNGIKAASMLANKNYPTVLAYADKTYFDLAYTPSMYEPGFTWATNFADTYRALTIADSADRTTQSTKNPQNIVGLEGALWSENIPSTDHLYYMALPKMTGLAEAAWARPTITNLNHKPNWQSLAIRLGCGKYGYLNYLHDTFAINYRGYPHGISAELPEDVSCPKN